ncbi:RagB/SusD family nutrient uptake outer membrane protein [Spirosoma sp. KCTC 42546]|uniref:RagB/SusD family nutrient uptake outer membrane protein n=1 Tax=Spirosoma sp. KCTC 42546 TaxID=2520506 RepID=UPI001158BAF0|nr:RagB/SusD family nutrient uptake outer membrane protein [Spirosoma sp. KCTC 42546]QDK78144.1 RagB/SusD family nutrient uptake outer membrane protein [Spirosoma sp. KCTC 42546]
MNSSIKYLLYAGAVSLLITACDNRLNVVPTQSIEQSQALNTEQDVQITLIGAYDGLSDVNLYGGGIQYIGDLMGDNRDVLFGGTYATIDEIWRKTVTTSNTVTRDFWLDGYNAINRANSVLSALAKVGETNRGNTEGQARFIRGALYFELVKAFGKSWNDGTATANPGVPLVLTPTTSVTDVDYRARNTVAEVYAQVLDDLTKAESLLPAEQSGGSGFATKGAAAAILARVYLQQQNYTAARDAANRVITSGTYALEDNFADVFNDATNESEIIFKVIVTDQDGANDLNTFYASSLNQGRGDVRVQTKFRQLYATGDVRGTFFNTAGQNTFTSKFNDQYGDVPVVRLAEMYLVRAEANLRLGTTTGATPLADVNLIRARAKAAPLTTVDLAAILLERRLELAFEGQQLPDIKRTAGTVGTVAYNANNLVLPIPQREIDTNKKLVQNPGY